MLVCSTFDAAPVAGSDLSLSLCIAQSVVGTEVGRPNSWSERRRNLMRLSIYRYRCQLGVQLSSGNGLYLYFLCKKKSE